jgi:hypothetical protein
LKIAQSHSPEGVKRGGAEAAMLLVPLVLQVVTNPDICIVSVKNRVSQNYIYCKRICFIENKKIVVMILTINYG